MDMESVLTSRCFSPPLTLAPLVPIVSSDGCELRNSRKAHASMTFWYHTSSCGTHLNAFSRAVRFSSQAVWLQYDIPIPPTWILPAVGWTSPRIALSSKDFPEPTAPVIAICCPLVTFILMSFKIVSASQPRFAFCIATIGLSRELSRPATSFDSGSLFREARFASDEYSLIWISLLSTLSGFWRKSSKRLKHPMAAPMLGIICTRRIRGLATRVMSITELNNLEASRSVVPEAAVAPT